MYYPLLRGRQFELIALREFAVQRGDKNNIIPIIEPVKSTFSSLNLAIAKFKEGKLNFAIILNPEVGEIDNQEYLLTNLRDEISENQFFIPAFIVNNNYMMVNQIIRENNLSNVMLKCNASIDISNPEFESLFFSGRIKYVVSEENRLLKRKLSGRGIEIIRLDDNFKGERRNSDYISKLDEKFSEEHIFFLEDGYQGFSDYTVVISEYSEGGAAPYAVAIHLTYKKINNEVWIKHFVSDTNDDRSNIQGKFAEAAGKAVTFLDSENIHSYASEELRYYYNNSMYPGLGSIKKISIKNHLELINGLL
jgi:hypothetical protein